MDFPYHSLPYTSDVFNSDQQQLKYEMLRSMSHGSMQHTRPEAAPSLLSSHSAPSLPSASSSTVGSPYLNHAMPVTTAGMYTDSYAANPMIIQDDFQYAFESTHYDHESSAGHCKLGPFVGKSAADLPLSAKRSTTIPVQECSPSLPLVSLPIPINAQLEASANIDRRSNLDDDGGRRIKAAKSCIDKSKTFDGIVFKSAITPASAYSKMSLPITKRTSKPQNSLGFTYTYPFMPGPTMFQRGYNSQSHFFPSSNGNFLPPVEAPCSSFFSFPFLRHLSAVVLC